MKKISRAWKKLKNHRDKPECPQTPQNRDLAEPQPIPSNSLIPAPHTSTPVGSNSHVDELMDLPVTIQPIPPTHSAYVTKPEQTPGTPDTIESSTHSIDSQSEPSDDIKPFTLLSAYRPFLEAKGVLLMTPHTRQTFPTTSSTPVSHYPFLHEVARSRVYRDHLHDKPSGILEVPTELLVEERGASNRQYGISGRKENRLNRSHRHDGEAEQLEQYLARLEQERRKMRSALMQQELVLSRLERELDRKDGQLRMCKEKLNASTKQKRDAISRALVSEFKIDCLEAEKHRLERKVHRLEQTLENRSPLKAFLSLWSFLHILICLIDIVRSKWLRGKKFREH
ncbi:hypothetical protein VNI00_006966 [Paramarasmius palmivorus]|uniref:Uncharacterized protein n=1 Tax=Paramarasmius palmivorus TaxID=297713 RepID=A0AAW0D6E8_9AGAR